MRENQSAIDELTAQISELQERLNFIDDSREFHGVSSMQWEIIPRSSSPAVIFNPSWYAEPRTKHARRRKKSARYTRCNRARQNQLSHCYMGDTRFANLTAQCSQRRARRDLWLKVRNTTETQFQLRDLHKDCRLEILTLRRKECTLPQNTYAE